MFRCSTASSSLGVNGCIRVVFDASTESSGGEGEKAGTERCKRTRKITGMLREERVQVECPVESVTSHLCKSSW